MEDNKTTQVYFKCHNCEARNVCMCCDVCKFVFCVDCAEFYKCANCMRAMHVISHKAKDVKHDCPKNCVQFQCRDNVFCGPECEGQYNKKLYGRLIDDYVKQFDNYNAETEKRHELWKHFKANPNVLIPR